MMKELLTGGLFAVVLLLGVSGAASAALMTITFDQQTALSGGKISYAGAGGPLVGNNIKFDFVLGTNTPSNSGVANALVGNSFIMDFKTGPFQSLTTTGNVTNLVFAGGGALTITGTGPYSNALIGTFSAANVTYDSNKDLLQIVASGSDKKGENLLSYFGITDPSITDSDNDFTFSFTINGGLTNMGPTGEFEILDVSSADLENFATTITVPEPGAISLVMLGIGLLGLVMVRRRRDEFI